MKWDKSTLRALPGLDTWGVLLSAYVRVSEAQSSPLRKRAPMTEANIRAAILDDLRGDRVRTAKAISRSVMKRYRCSYSAFDACLARLELDGAIELVGKSGAFKYRIVKP